MEGYNGRTKRSQAKQMEAIQNVVASQDKKVSMQETRAVNAVRRASSGSIASKKDCGEVCYQLKSVP